MALLTSKGAHGIPGSAIVVLAATLSAVPVIPAIGLVLVLSVDWFMGMARALGNMTGNCVATVVIAAWEGDIDRARAHAVLDGTHEETDRGHPGRAARGLSAKSGRVPRMPHAPHNPEKEIRMPASRLLWLATAASLLAAPAVADEKIILLINPNSNDATTQSMTEIAAKATEGVATVEGRSNEGVPPLLTTPKDLADAIPGVVKIGVEAAKDERVAAIIIAAFGDPGLEELRAEVDLPVFGIREQAFHEAARDGRAFGIATTTPDPGLAEAFRQTAAALGYEDQFRGTRATPGDPNELMRSPPTSSTRRWPKRCAPRWPTARKR